MGKNYSHFTKDKRNEISILLKKGYSHQDIANAVGKNRSSITREISRNKVKGEYDPSKAHHRAYVKRKYSKYQGMKVVENTELRDYIEEKIKGCWTPEETAGRLKFRNNNQTVISTPGIYKYLYSSYGQYLCQYLPSRQYYKRKRRAKKQKREIIKNRVFINKRSDLINERKRYGDWEGDTLGRIKTDREAIAGLVERKSRYFISKKIPGLKYTIDGFKQMLNPYQHILHSLTLDNGTENAKYEELGIKIYFCNPYSSWEKGTMENTFKRLRRFIPKKSSLRNYTNNDILKIAEIMNNTPRKCLGFRTPKEVFEEQLYLRRNTS